MKGRLAADQGWAILRPSKFMKIWNHCGLWALEGGALVLGGEQPECKRWTFRKQSSRTATTAARSRRKKETWKGGRNHR